MCPCYSLRLGSFLLALAGCLAVSSRVLFGVDAAAFLNAALAGNVMPVAWCWAAIVVVGLWQSIAGLRAALSHSDPIRFFSLFWSACAIWMVTTWLPHARQTGEFSPQGLAWLSAFGTAWAVEHGANIWLQLRGLFGVGRRRRPVPVPDYQPAPSSSAWLWQRRRIVIEEEAYYVERNGGAAAPWQRPPLPASLPHAAPRVPQIDYQPPGRFLPAPDTLKAFPPLRRKDRAG